MTQAKVVSLEQLAETIAAQRSAGKTVVHCHGCFDLLHIGHIRYLKQARQQGDFLVVTLTPDRYVDKGSHRPAFPEALRAEALAALDGVDRVAINRWPTAEETLRLLRPDVYVKGADFQDAASDTTGKLGLEEKVVREIGARMAFTRDVVFSSSNLINRYFSAFPKEVQTYLAGFRQRYRAEDILGFIDAMDDLSVLVVGDTIIDDYQFCHTIGTSSKDPVLSVQYDAHDLFAGGVLALANHVAGFAGQVRLVSVIGEKDSFADFIRSRLKANVDPHFTVNKGAPTLVKRRFIEGYSLNKLFEIYIMDDSGLDAQADQALCRWLEKEMARHDLVIVGDFGHGAVSDRMRQTLVEKAPYLAVNTQANSGNRGFHTISRYARADYVSLAEHEMRLQARDMKGDLRPMMDHMGARLKCKNFVVTRGKKGSLLRTQDGTIVHVPALARRVVDRIGAGDAFLSITAMAAYLDVPAEAIGFIGNIVGALAVETVGNKKPIDKENVRKNIVSLLK